MRITVAKIRQKAKEWCKLHYRLLPVTICKDYAVKHHLPYTAIIPEKEVPVTPVRYCGEPQRDDVSGTLPERYMAVLKNVEIIGASNVIIGNNSIVYDLLATKKETYNITDIGLFRVLNSPVHFGKKYVTCYQNKGVNIEKGLYLAGNFSSNYYHFIYEILVKWYLIDQMNVPQDVPIIVDVSAHNIPQFKELLSLFSKGRNIIYINKLELIKVATLYYPSMVNFIPPNLKKMEYLTTEDVVFDLNAIRYLRNKFLDYMGVPQKKTPKKFFISRKSSKWRQYNEKEVIEVVLSKGYEVVYPETMTAKEQFGLFNQADEIVAASGAAFANIICCKPHTKILILVSVRVDGAIYSTIAKALDLQLEYLVGSITNYNNVQSDFIIDSEKLREALEI